jgi:hypothetical protein
VVESVNGEPDTFKFKDFVKFPCNCVLCGTQKNKIPLHGFDCFVLDTQHVDLCGEDDEVETIKLNTRVYAWACKKHSDLLKGIFITFHFFERFYTELKQCTTPFDMEAQKKPISKWKADPKGPEQIQVVCKYKDYLKSLEDIVK